MFSTLDAILNFLLYLYLPTLDKSYLLASNNNPYSKLLAASTCKGSPGLNFLYISSNASSVVFTVSL